MKTGLIIRQHYSSHMFAYVSVFDAITRPLLCLFCCVLLLSVRLSLAVIYISNYICRVSVYIYIYILYILYITRWDVWLFAGPTLSNTILILEYHIYIADLPIYFDFKRIPWTYPINYQLSHKAVAWSKLELLCERWYLI